MVILLTATISLLAVQALPGRFPSDSDTRRVSPTSWPFCAPHSPSSSFSGSAFGRGLLETYKIKLQFQTSDLFLREDYESY